MHFNVFEMFTGQFTWQEGLHVQEADWYDFDTYVKEKIKDQNVLKKLRTLPQKRKYLTEVLHLEIQPDSCQLELVFDVSESQDD